MSGAGFPLRGVLDGTEGATASSLRARALDCYRAALKAADPAEAELWIGTGGWFEQAAREAEDGPDPAGEPDDGSVVAFPLERRRSRRVPLRDGALLVVRGRVLVVRTQDVSRGGARLLLPEEAGLAAGEALSLSIPGVCHARPGRVVGMDGRHLRLEFSDAG